MLDDCWNTTPVGRLYRRSHVSMVATLGFTRPQVFDRFRYFAHRHMCYPTNWNTVEIQNLLE